MALIFLVVTLPAQAQAGPSPLAAEVIPMTLRPRTQAPAHIEIKLHCQSHSLLQGTLEVQCWGDGRLIGRQEIADLALLSGTSTQRLFLPPPIYARTVEEVRLRFLTQGAVYELGRFPTTSESPASRQYVIGICRPEFGVGETQNLIWRALRPERVLKEDRSGVAAVATTPAWFAPEDLPSSLGLCAFDVVVLEGPALAALSEKQLADIATWVEAGGSLCLVALRDLKAEHLAFLQRLSVGGEESAGKERPLLRRAGLGRVAMLAAPPAGEEQLMSEPWVAATYHLAHAEATDRPANARNNHSQWYYQYGVSNDLEAEMLGALPRSARMIPMPVLGVILAGFVLLVGPGDWLVLGRLRRRRWTWITFPFIAIGCTFLTVRMAEHYLGREDQRVSLILTDYSPQGHALRENRLDLWFVGRNRDAVAEKHQALSVPFVSVGNSRGVEQQKPPVYEGRVPSHYTLRQPVSQWTPYVQRSLIFAPASNAASHLKWEALHELPPDFNLNKTHVDDPISAKFVSEKIGAQGWTVHVFHPHLLRSDRPSLAERICLSNVDAWSFTRSPSGEAGSFDFFLDHERNDMLVVAQRHVGHEILIERCVYHFDSHE